MAKKLGNKGLKLLGKWRIFVNGDLQEYLCTSQETLSMDLPPETIWYQNFSVRNKAAH